MSLRASQLLFHKVLLLSLVWVQEQLLICYLTYGHHSILKLVDIAREHFGLSDLERGTKAGGTLSIHIGDALSSASVIDGGFAGIIVDLFSGGKILPQLSEVATWVEMKKKLMPNGRIMVNCGGAHAEVAESGYIKVNRSSSSDDSWVHNSTIRALCRAFPGELNWKRMESTTSENYLALTGTMPKLEAWSEALPHPLSKNVRSWSPCQLAV
ncbi:hypothetical protein HPP92_014067 [Vanilla planifolia]|uniref:Uncharacterized protein n=1 Tax=Vanilla planifolia TaxID=51239 RepID=A0A835QJB7_VANPL|nr:hypothetical protein HPP92_014509 [Vanilla planifolia]KAG0474381.1 hypothetical protein HPP92_014067 [Vanilla planifolia]